MSLRVRGNYTRYPSEDILAIGRAVLQGDECKDFRFDVVYTTSRKAAFASFKLEGGQEEEDVARLLLLPPTRLGEGVERLAILAEGKLPFAFVKQLAFAFALVVCAHHYRPEARERAERLDEESGLKLTVLPRPVALRPRRSREEKLRRATELYEKAVADMDWWLRAGSIEHIPPYGLSYMAHDIADIFRRKERARKEIQRLGGKDCDDLPLGRVLDLSCEVFRRFLADKIKEAGG